MGSSLLITIAFVAVLILGLWAICRPGSGGVLSYDLGDGYYLLATSKQGVMHLMKNGTSVPLLILYVDTGRFDREYEGGPVPSEVRDYAYTVLSRNKEAIKAFQRRYA